MRRALAQPRFNQNKIAELLAPLGPVIVWMFTMYDPNGYLVLFWYVFIFIFSAFCSYLNFFLLGLPLINFLRRKNIYNFFTVFISGGITGIVAVYIILLMYEFLLGSLHIKGFFSSETTLWGLKNGILVSLAYWMIDKIETRYFNK